ncbi:HDOD domain-containing protein [Alteromonadaceae bacterium M269]|nr:HDOD domain-containing protein [Alteromonadaceae bacterium M269]
MFKSIVSTLFGEPRKRKFHAPGLNEDRSVKINSSSAFQRNNRQLPPSSSYSVAKPSGNHDVAGTITIKLTKELNKLDYLFYEYLFGETERIDTINEIEQTVLSKIDNLLEAPNEVIAAFPVLPASISQLVSTLSNDDFNLIEFIGVVQKEPPVAAELIKIANSPSYKRGDEEIKDLNRAFMLIGAQGIKQHLLEAFVKQVSQVNPIYFKRFGEKIWAHSREVATVAYQYSKAAGYEPIADSAYLVGLIHDLGKIAIFQLLTESFKLVCLLDDPGSSVFKQIMSDKSLLLSTKLSKAWKLPEDITQAIADILLPLEERTPLGKIIAASNTISELCLLKQAKMLNDEEVKHILDSKRVNGVGKEIAYDFLKLNAPV